MKGIDFAILPVGILLWLVPSRLQESGPEPLSPAPLSASVPLAQFVASQEIELGSGAVCKVSVIPAGSVLSDSGERPVSTAVSFLWANGSVLASIHSLKSVPLHSDESLTFEISGLEPAVRDPAAAGIVLGYAVSVAPIEGLLWGQVGSAEALAIHVAPH